MKEARRPRGGRRLGVTAATLVLAGGALVACGIPDEAAPERVTGENVPFRLALPDTTTSSTAPAVTSEAVPVYFVSDRLVPVIRELAAPPTLSAVLAALAAGPSDDEARAGLRSALPAAGLVRSVELSGGAAIVNITSGFAAVPPGDQIVALAQIVFTLTERPGVGRVGFRLDGTTIEVPRADGSLTSEPVSRDDYAPLAPG